MGSSWIPNEIKLFQKLMADYAVGHLGISKGNWSEKTWQRLSDIYNQRAADMHYECRGLEDMLVAGNQIYELFCGRRAMHEKQGTAIDEELSVIFGPCNHCHQRIPVFPTSLNQPNSVNAGARSNSIQTGSDGPPKARLQVGTSGDISEEAMHFKSFVVEFAIGGLVN